MDAMDDAGLMELSRYAQILLELLLRERVEHSRVDERVHERLGILGQTDFMQPLQSYPAKMSEIQLNSNSMKVHRSLRVAELPNHGISNEIWSSLFFDGKS